MGSGEILGGEGRWSCGAEGEDDGEAGDSGRRKGETRGEKGRAGRVCRSRDGTKMEGLVKLC